ncbi:hypothetical protein M378DRAFT_164677 [Amanita muscaria Koide BX008]|uniref:VWFA domain-containing protein n=1 Tax=Amanita muscaria (strain Koide BX008) TaxID=946122 RepID=A0A0C2SJH8_AMAMK|nr:hypothetical protein M378DRAFT_164677 [Amanita muscaria Koide BX008]
MPFEATMMIIDNSEYMRNGDYVPTRFQAQADAVNTVFQTKIDSNPENTVGIMTMAGKGPEVLVTHTKDVGQILGGIHTATSKIGGNSNIPTAINIAQLALKHRENKTLRQRIIVFVASPLEGQAADEKAMIRLAKNLKKNNVAVDFVCFGDGIEEERRPDGVDGEHKPVLRSFIENVNSSDNSHLVIVPPSTELLSDALIASPILAEDRTASIPQELLPGGAGAGAAEPSAAGPSAQNNFEFGVDPNLDPELALALRMSMQEAQAREAAEAAAAGPSSSSAPAQNSSSTTITTPAPALIPVPATTAAPAAAAPATVPADPTEDEEERLLQQALAMSQQHEHEQDDEDVDMDDNDDDMGVDEEEDEDEAIQRAIAMSMQDKNDQPGKDGKK